MRPIQIKNNITHTTVEKHLKREEEELREKNKYHSPYYSSQHSVQFYEWSNTNSSPKVFNTSFLFVEFLKQCNIAYTNAQLNMIYDIAGTVYATCKKGEASLLVASTMAGLKLLMETTYNQSSANLSAIVNHEN